MLSKQSLFGILNNAFSAYHVFVGSPSSSACAFRGGLPAYIFVGGGLLGLCVLPPVVLLCYFGCRGSPADVYPDNFFADDEEAPLQQPSAIIFASSLDVKVEVRDHSRKLSQRRGGDPQPFLPSSLGVESSRSPQPHSPSSPLLRRPRGARRTRRIRATRRARSPRTASPRASCSSRLGCAWRRRVRRRRPGRRRACP